MRPEDGRSGSCGNAQLAFSDHGAGAGWPGLLVQRPAQQGLLSVILPLLVALALAPLMVWLVFFLHEEGFDDTWFVEGETGQSQASGEGGPADVDDGASPG
jgi:hypothetical protein